MTMYEIEFIRRMPGHDEPAVIDVYSASASDLQQVIYHAGLSLRAATFRVRPESFRIRENGGPVVFEPVSAR